MWKKKLAGRLVMAAVIFMSAQGIASAQATRTWVSGVGDDANPCSRTAPCKTFAGAISKTAAGGEISILDPGGYGGVTITKSILINGAEAGEGGVLVSGTNAIVIAAGGGDRVTLRGLTIEGLGSGLAGVRFNSGQSLHIEDCQIRGFRGSASASGVTFAPSGSVNARLFIKNSVITDNGQGSSGGIHIQPTGGALADVTIEKTTISNNVGWGVRADGNSVVTIRNSTLNSTWNNGVVAIGLADPVQVTIEGSTISDNGWGASGGAGIVANGSLALVRISDNLITNNAAGLVSSGGGIIQSFGDNRLSGNDVDGNPTSTATKR
ncbi:right-handed parallel beta-helix repeat-containing protein [Lysobacter terrae]